MKTTKQILKLIKDNNFNEIKKIDLSKKINTIRSVKIGGFTDDNGMNIYIKERFSPFMFAVYKNNKKIVEHFLNKYKDDLNINLENKNGKTALMLLMDRTKYKVGLDIFGLLLKHHNFDINYQNKNGETALMLAAENNSPIIKNLLKHKADPNSKDNNGETSLMKASRYGYFRIIKELVDHGANVNDTIKKSYFNGRNIHAGETPLIYLCSTKDPFRKIDCITYLLDHGADVSIKGSYGTTALDVLKNSSSTFSSDINNLINLLECYELNGELNKQVKQKEQTTKITYKRKF